MTPRTLTVAGVLALIVLIVASASVFTVSQTQQALVLEFGRPVRVVSAPGLNVKMPFVQNVEFYDKRLLDFNAEPKEVIASDQKRLMVDAFVRYRITDPLRFKQTVGDERTMRSRLNTILESSLRQAVGNVPLSDVISGSRGKVVQSVRAMVNQQASGGASPDARDGFGIEVVDVRIVRADLPQANSESIYRRMQTEREREAKEFRAKGAEDAQKIRSTAEKERTILLADARRKSEILRGEGDSEATKIFAESINQDPDFYQFYRTMQAYRKSLSSQDTTLVLSPDSSEFLKYLERGTK
jgi:membrane protease subunit HflC